MSASLEEYLKTIYILMIRNSYVRVTDIAIEIGCTKPSVNRALKLLREEECITYENYGDIYLTKKGIEKAKDIVKKHETLKAFLVKALDIDECIAEKEAKSMKHSVSEDTINRLEKYIQSIINVEEIVCNYNPKDEKCKKCARKPKGNNLS